MARLKEVRKALKMSQEKFAERAGLKYKHYQSVEAGRKLNISFETLEKLAKATGLEIWELLNFDSVPAILAEDRAKGEPETKEKRISKGRKRGIG